MTKRGGEMEAEGEIKTSKTQDKLRIPSNTKGQSPLEGSKDEGKDFLPCQQERDWSSPGGKYRRGKTNHQISVKLSG